MWCEACGEAVDRDDICRTCGLCDECCDCDVLDADADFFTADEMGWEPDVERDRRLR